ncbi:gamma-glutamyltransferase [Leucothrix pacifica]|uniref:Glutathione hydrolase proenzyme n=1 Tax=Leucothrix pacifica TaxID=1247513 RepID=A0A317C2Q2_9GAMM|nr:gamma-glutamyltransferase [Leucothrix pacifica]PWQ92609.1 gamma-glutamyltransferase [Leucothrix pacifica]
MKRAITLLATAISCALISSAVVAKETRYPEFGNGRIEQNLVKASEYMVSSANPYASEAGMRIIEKGGSAIDAAIAVQMVLNLVEPESSGIGGGAFSLYWDNEKKTLSSYDGREKAPMLADGKLFQENGKNMSWWEALAGGRAVGVPGVVAMMEKVHKQHGKLPWAELFEDAIKLSEEGFEVSPKLAASIANRTNPALGRYEATWNYFFPDGKPLKAGVMKKNPEFAMTLRRIALLGAKGFYKGQIAMDIVAAARFTAADNPGLLTIDDMINYEAIERPPVCAPYKQFKVCGMGPPTSGGMTVIQILKLLEDKDLAQYEPLSVEAAHLFAQAGKLAYADRGKYMADADFVNVPVEGLIDGEYLKERAKLIGDKDMGKATAGTPPNADTNWIESKSPEQPSTTHFSIVDKQGNGFSMTSSIEMAFGSTVMVRGFLLNNQLTDFSFSEEKDGEKIANRVQPGKRPRSSMSPFMVFDKDDNLVMAVGSPGGSRIINYVAKTMLGVMEWNMDIQEAISMPHYVSRNGETDLEKGTKAAELKEGLEALGHKVSVRDLNSGLHGITISKDGLEGGADPRRVGRAMGK